IRSFPPYGRLSGKNLDELMAGARVEVDERKRDPRDFALWKGAKPGEPAWDSPWGQGRPGWHIECSAMAMKYLGATFDVHGGGEDLIFPHHECEIAQTEACTGKPFARYWVHNGMVNMGKEKMSKSLGNTLNIREIVKRHDPDALRLWMLGTHYRNMIEWSEERVGESARALERLARLIHDAAAARDGGGPTSLPPAFAEFRPRFERAMDDDFNTPQALGVLFDFGRALAEARDRGAGGPRAFVAGVDELGRRPRRLGGVRGHSGRRGGRAARRPRSSSGSRRGARRERAAISGGATSCATRSDGSAGSSRTRRPAPDSRRRGGSGGRPRLRSQSGARAAPRSR